MSTTASALQESTYPSYAPRTTAFRGLSEHLKEVERRLTSWGQWTRQQEEGGFPKRCVLERFKEGGISAGSPRPPTVLPQDAAEVDHAIAKLPREWQFVARINWQFGELHREQRALRAGLSDRTFKRRVEVIRDHVRYVLKL